MRYRGPVVVLVHGSLDRSSSFVRTALRLPEWPVVAYDRRGYQGSRDAPIAESLQAHVDDLLGVAGAYAGAATTLFAVGHSVGGTVVLGAAVATPSRFASVGAYEPSMPWLGFHRPDGRRAQPTREGIPGASAEPGTRHRDAALEAERFFRRMVGDAAWERLPEPERASRRADGPALVADLRSLRRDAPFDVEALVVPAVVAAGGPSSFLHHRQTAQWLAEHVASVRLVSIPEAGHGVHFSHPDAFAGLVRRVVALGNGGGPA
jgi:pimeloyl-ACP methyl ester carboxylesterase